MSSYRALRWNLRSGTPYLSTGRAGCDICGAWIRSGDLVYRAEVWTNRGETSYLTEIHEQCSTPQPLPPSVNDAQARSVRSAECIHGGSPDTCPACVPASSDTVWMTMFGFRFHSTPHCGALLNGQRGALAAGKTENPIFETTLEMAAGFGAHQCGSCFRTAKKRRSAKAWRYLTGYAGQVSKPMPGPRRLMLPSWQSAPAADPEPWRGRDHS